LADVIDNGSSSSGGGRGRPSYTVSTFHSLLVRILRYNGEHLDDLPHGKGLNGKHDKQANGTTTTTLLLLFLYLNTSSHR